MKYYLSFIPLLLSTMSMNANAQDPFNRPFTCNNKQACIYTASSVEDENGDHDFNEDLKFRDSQHDFHRRLSDVLTACAPDGIELKLFSNTFYKGTAETIPAGTCQTNLVQNASSARLRPLGCLYNQVCGYSKNNFKDRLFNRSAHLLNSRYGYAFNSNHNNNISSLCASKYQDIILYDGIGFEGEHRIIKASTCVRTFKSFNNKASYYIQRPSVCPAEKGCIYNIRYTKTYDPGQFSIRLSDSYFDNAAAEACAPADANMAIFDDDLFVRHSSDVVRGSCQFASNRYTTSSIVTRVPSELEDRNIALVPLHAIESTGYNENQQFPQCIYWRDQSPQAILNDCSGDAVIGELWKLDYDGGTGSYFIRPAFINSTSPLTLQVSDSGHFSLQQKRTTTSIYTDQSGNANQRFYFDRQGGANYKIRLASDLDSFRCLGSGNANFSLLQVRDCNNVGSGEGGTVFRVEARN